MIQTQYQILFKFSGKQPKRPTNTKYISILPNQRFSDLVQDICDEINRRRDQVDPFLPIRTDLQSKRNQARQKMATLSVEKLKELSMDLMIEIQKRYPEVVESFQNQVYSRSKNQSPTPMDIPRNQRTPPRNQSNTNRPNTPPAARGDVELKKTVRDKKNPEAKLSELEYDNESLQKSLLKSTTRMEQVEMELQEWKQKYEKKEIDLNTANKLLAELEKKNEEMEKKLAELQSMTQQKSIMKEISDKKMESKPKTKKPSIRDTIVSIAKSVDVRDRYSRYLSVQTKPLPLPKSPKTGLLSPTNSNQEEFGPWVFEEYEKLIEKVLKYTTGSDVELVLEPLKELLVLSMRIQDECDLVDNMDSITEREKDDIFEQYYKMSDTLASLLDICKTLASTRNSKHISEVNECVEEVTLSMQDWFDLYRKITTNVPTSKFKTDLTRSSQIKGQRKSRVSKRFNVESMVLESTNGMSFEDMIEEVVDDMALCIQNLLSELKKSSPDPNTIEDVIIQIHNHVDFTIQETMTAPIASNDSECRDILDDIANTKDDLLNECDYYLDTQMDVKPLANAAFILVKYAKELVTFLST